MKGAKTGGLPIEHPTALNLVVNKKTANALRIKIPPELLVRADEVIESAVGLLQDHAICEIIIDYDQAREKWHTAGPLEAAQMSELGQSRRFRPTTTPSGLPSAAESGRRYSDRREVS